MQKLSPRNARRLRRWSLIAAVAAAHIGLFVLLGRIAPTAPPSVMSPGVLVTLFQPPPPPPPPPPVEPARRPGGGAPAAPSRVHTPPPPKQRPPDSPPAPPVQAPEPTLVVGAAPTATPEPGLGQGGQGTGTGTGVGSGNGPGSGTPPMILRRASTDEILSYVPPQARAARQAGRAGVRCRIRLDTTVDSCTVVGETPPGFGFGEAARVIAARYSRFRPGTDAAGRPVDTGTVVITIEFGRQPGRR